MVASHPTRFRPPNSYFKLIMTVLEPQNQGYELKVTNTWLCTYRVFIAFTLFVNFYSVKISSKTFVGSCYLDEIASLKQWKGGKECDETCSSVCKICQRTCCNLIFVAILSCWKLLLKQVIYEFKKNKKLF
jgi:hypothetical protein